MSHSIQAIVAPSATAETIVRDWPELPRLDRDNGYAIFPVDAERIDAHIAPDRTPAVSGETFMLLTHGFRKLLRTLSRGGVLAYIETEYFGGVGGQGAVVCRDGDEIMPPTWQADGVINDALKLIGLRRGLLADRFAAAGLADVRDNEDLLRLNAEQGPTGRRGDISPTDPPRPAD